MKTSSQYRAQAWNEFRALFKESFVLICVLMAICLVAFLVFYFSFAFREHLHTTSLLSMTMLIVVMLLLMGTLGLLNYYVPVWFLHLMRKRELRHSETQTGYIRAISVFIFTIVPAFVLSIIMSFSHMLDALPEKSVWVLLIALLILALIVAAYCFVFWWAYAVSALLPYIVHDNKDMTVWQAVKQSIAMMNGHKWALFKVDLRIYLWPLILILIFVLSMSVPVAYSLSRSAQSMAPIVIMGVGTVVLFLVMLFVNFPMDYFARAQFYEDLLANGRKENLPNDTEKE